MRPVPPAALGGLPSSLAPLGPTGTVAVDRAEPPWALPRLRNRPPVAREQRRDECGGFGGAVDGEHQASAVGAVELERLPGPGHQGAHPVAAPRAPAAEVADRG